MKWGVRRDPERQRRKELKRDYKSFDKHLREQHKALDSARFKTDRDISKSYRGAKKANKKLYRAKTIDKDEYKRNIKSLNRQAEQYRDANELRWIDGSYSVARMRRVNKLTYISEIKGEQSKTYQRGLKAYNKGIETIAYDNITYDISKKDGKYDVHKTYLYWM